MHSVPVPINVRCYSNSDIIVRRSEVTLRAIKILAARLLGKTFAQMAMQESAMGSSNPSKADCAMYLIPHRFFASGTGAVHVSGGAEPRAQRRPGRSDRRALTFSRRMKKRRARNGIEV
jgi:hypothetical protein